MTDGPGGVVELDAELDALYAAPLAEFVERRDALAKRLKIAGAADPARAVKALRKPTAVAWAINRLHFESRDAKGRAAAGGLAPLEAASAALRGALRDPRSAEERRRAIDARRRALEAATTSVAAILEAAGTSVGPALLRRVERTLLAIAAGGGGPGAATPGRLDQELEPPGFEALADFPAPQPPPSREAKAMRAAPVESAAAAKSAMPAKAPPAKKAPPIKAPPSSAERSYVPSRDRQREAALAAAQRAVDDADAELERATAKAESARARVDDAEKTLEQARREVEAARRELVAARTRLSERRRDLDRLRGG